MIDWAYFDYAATTPVAPAVLAAYADFQQRFWANAGSSHGLGLLVRREVEIARAAFAQVIGADAREIVFTSGATEANNLALKGALRYHGVKQARLLTVATEHKAVLDIAAAVAKEGVCVEVLPVLSDGLIDWAALERALEQPCTLVSVMAVNNETGVLQPIKAIADLVHKHGAKLHVDAAQALGKIALDMRDWQADLVSFSGHKCYAPKGIGALFVRRLPKMRLQAQQQGGGQERGRRSGTLPAPLILAFVLAAQLAEKERENNNALVLEKFNHIMTQLPETIGLNREINTPAVAHIFNLALPCSSAQALRLAEEANLALSAGSACQSATAEGSYVLQAMGRKAEQGLRVSLSHLTTDLELARLSAFLQTLG